MLQECVWGDKRERELLRLTGNKSPSKIYLGSTKTVWSRAGGQKQQGILSKLSVKSTVSLAVNPR